MMLYGGGVAQLLGFRQFKVQLLLGTNTGVRVMTTDMYTAVTAAPTDLATAAAVGTPLLVFGIVLVMVQRLLLGDQARFVTHGGKAFRLAGKPSPLAALFIIVFAVVTTGFPMVSLLIHSLSSYWSPKVRISRMTLENFQQIFSESGIVSVVTNSITVSIMAVCISLLIGFIVACVSLRGQRVPILRTLRDIVVAMPLGVSAVIFGTGFLFAYSRPPIILYGSWWLLVVVYVTLILPLTTRMRYRACWR